VRILCQAPIRSIKDECSRHGLSAYELIGSRSDVIMLRPTLKIAQLVDAKGLSDVLILPFCSLEVVYSADDTADTWIEREVCQTLYFVRFVIAKFKATETLLTCRYFCPVRLKT
jgi:hypothetical protein